MAPVGYSTVPYYSYSVLSPCRRSSTLSGWRLVSWGLKAWPCWTVLIRTRWKTSRPSWPCSAPVHLLQLHRLTTALTHRALSHLATPKNTRPNRYRAKYLELINNKLKIHKQLKMYTLSWTWNFMVLYWDSYLYGKQTTAFIKTAQK